MNPIKNAEVLALYKSSNNSIKYADIKDYKIAYREVGNGYPLIIANRFRGNLDTWDPAFLDELAKNFRVITFDYRGTGSSSGKQATDYIEMATDMKDLAEFLQIKKFAAGGWSLGGFVAELVITEFPEIVSAGIFIGTRPPGKDVKPPRDIFFKTAVIPDYGLEEEIILFFHPKYDSSRIAAERSRARLELRKTDFDRPMNKEQWEKMFALEGFRNDEHGTLKKLQETKIPYLVIVGEDDICFPAEDWFSLNGKLPNSQIVLMAETGHGPQHQFPELSAKYITDFINSRKIP